MERRFLKSQPKRGIPTQGYCPGVDIHRKVFDITYTVLKLLHRTPYPHPYLFYMSQALARVPSGWGLLSGSLLA